MVNELKNEVIFEMEKLISKMYLGYPVNLCNLIDKIYYIKSLK